MHSQDVRNQGRLAAEAEQHARDVKERNRFMRQIAAQSGVMQLPGLSHVQCFQHVAPSTCETSGARWGWTTDMCTNSQWPLSVQLFGACNVQHRAVLVSNWITPHLYAWLCTVVKHLPNCWAGPLACLCGCSHVWSTVVSGWCCRR